MKKILDKILVVFEKVPAAAYACTSFIKSFLAAAVFFIAIFVILWAAGIYAKLETALDLKYNSPIITAPMWAFAALSLVCLVVGFLLYFHKYKRGKIKTDFYNSVAPAFGKNKPV